MIIYKSSKVDQVNPTIQALRGIAVLLVVVYHTNLALPGGFLGVDVFFVISGFVISSMLWREIKQTQQFKPSVFLAKRARRLLPGLYAMVFAVLVYSVFFESWTIEQGRTGVSSISALLSVSNWKFAFDELGYFSLESANDPLLHTWSLGLEEQWYLLLPLVIFGLIRFGRFKSKQFPILLLSSLMLFGCSLLLQIRFSLYTSSEISQLLPARQFVQDLFDPFYGFFGRIWQFLLGIYSFILASRPNRFSKRFSIVICTLCLSLIFGMSFATNGSVPRWSFANITVCLATSVILYATHDVKMSDVLNLKPLVWLGDRSYGWYLWHWPFIVVANRYWGHRPLVSVLAVVAGLGIALISYRFIEQPIRHLIITPSQTVRLLAPAFVVVLGLVLSIQYLITPYLSQRFDGKYYEQVEGCFPNFELCVYPNQFQRHFVLLEGDSHALSLSQPVRELALQLKYGLIICTKQCLSSNPVDTIAKRFNVSSVISMRQFQAVPNDGFFSLIDFAKNTSEMEILFVLDNPRFEQWYFPSLLGPRTNDILLADVLGQQSASRNLMIGLAGTMQNVEVLDSLKYLCDDKLCATEYAGNHIYYDDNHLNTYGARRLMNPIADFLSR
jgi:peptidoglycan/LPS O-acetylase OafA/YrhL